MNKKIFLNFFLVALLVNIVATLSLPIGNGLIGPRKAVAQVRNTPANNAPSNTPVSNANFDDDIGVFENPIGIDTFPALVVRIMKMILALLGTVAVVVIIVSGFRMVLSQGNAEALKSAKDGVTWAVIGLIVALLAYSMINIVQNLLKGNA